VESLGPETQFTVKVARCESRCMTVIHFRVGCGKPYRARDGCVDVTVFSFLFCPFLVATSDDKMQGAGLAAASSSLVVVVASRLSALAKKSPGDKETTRRWCRCRRDDDHVCSQRRYGRR
jgi:hypothetical protein